MSENKPTIIERILSYLEEDGPKTIAELAYDLHVRRGSVTVMMHRLRKLERIHEIDYKRANKSGPYQPIFKIGKRPEGEEPPKKPRKLTQKQVNKRYTSKNKAVVNRRNEKYKHGEVNHWLRILKG